MTDTNLTAVFYAPGDIRLQDADIPEPGADQVQIRIENVGICGSDLSLWLHGGIRGFLEASEPFAIGHEGAGVVSKIGEEVKSLEIGKLPGHVSLEEGAMIEPLAVALYGCRRAGVSGGDKVLISGAGPIGLLTLLVSKVFGASSVCVTEVRENRIEMAKKLGADCTLNVTSKEPKEIAEMVEKFFGEKPNIAIECSGAASATQAAVYATRQGGRLTQVGLGDANINFPIISATAREVDIVGILSNPYCAPLALEMVASGRIDVKPIITHRYELEDVTNAFKLAESREGGKVIVKCRKS